MECVIEAKAIMILQCIDGCAEVAGHVEEGSLAAWFTTSETARDRLAVCVRERCLMKEGNKIDKIDRASAAEAAAA